MSALFCQVSREAGEAWAKGQLSDGRLVLEPGPPEGLFVGCLEGREEILPLYRLWRRLPFGLARVRLDGPLKGFLRHAEIVTACDAPGEVRLLGPCRLR